MIIKLILKQDGGLALRSHRETCGIQQLRPRQLSGNSTTIGAKVGILGDPHPGLNSSEFCLFRDTPFACQKFEFPGNRREVWTDTPAARHICTYTVTPQITQHRCRVCMAQGACRAQF